MAHVAHASFRELLMTMGTPYQDQPGMRGADNPSNKYSFVFWKCVILCNWCINVHPCLPMKTFITLSQGVTKGYCHITSHSSSLAVLTIRWWATERQLPHILLIMDFPEVIGKMAFLKIGTITTREKVSCRTRGDRKGNNFFPLTNQAKPKSTHTKQTIVWKKKRKKETPCRHHCKTSWKLYL